MPDALPGLFLGQSDAAQPENLLFNRANRHGVVAGATACGAAGPGNTHEDAPCTPSGWDLERGSGTSVPSTSKR